ncbi:MAG: site-2 protease family protein, partial [Bacillota bacterium]|nr:site-2 protease family protein [Bacillota bacterium]
MLGFKIDEFAIGFGPKLAKFKSRKTGILYSLRPFPIGGFVKFHGEDEATGDADEFSKKPIWKRFIAIFAGAAFNIIFALILAIIFLTIFGERLP